MLNGIDFDAVYASDMTRAMRTAELILPASGNTDLTVQPMAAFREAFYGYFEGDDTSQTWFMVGAPHQAPSLSAIIEQYGIEKAKDFCKEADPFHRAENITPNSGNGSMAVSIRYVLTITTGTKFWSSATAIRFTVLLLVLPH
ncbi:histidine phosphatase family protein [Lactiplantibacillus plantarum]|uniref:histidine phosphatase family protein n=1 Tax=Lactiplantibacillus plantarum TaxID=1590 RepID=UPI0021CAEF22|nr:histidine phosphatase family protein [Lactiplantibacillus plantarum]